MEHTSRVWVGFPADSAGIDWVSRTKLSLLPSNSHLKIKDSSSESLSIIDAITPDSDARDAAAAPKILIVKTLVSCYASSCMVVLNFQANSESVRDLNFLVTTICAHETREIRSRAT